MSLGKKANIIMISNQKGGVGKTTCTLELSNIFATDFKVLAIDLDPQRNLSTYSGADLDAKYTLKNVLDAEVLVQDAIQHLNNFDIIIGDKKLSNASKLYGDADDIFLLQDILEDIENEYDYIFLDSAPGRSPLLYMEYICSDYIIAPTECDDGSIEGLAEIGEDIKRFKKREQTHVRILGTLLNKYENTSMHSTSFDDLEDIGPQIGGMPFRTVIRKSIAASEAKTARCSISEYSKNNNISKDYATLKKEIINRIHDYEEELL